MKCLIAAIKFHPSSLILHPLKIPRPINSVFRTSVDEDFAGALTLLYHRQYVLGVGDDYVEEVGAVVGEHFLDGGA